MDKETRDMIGTAAFVDLLASMDPDDLDSYVIPALPAPFGGDEPERFWVARVGRSHILVDTHNDAPRLRVHAHKSEQEAADCHRKNAAETRAKIALGERMADAMRRGDFRTVMECVTAMAQSVGVDVQMFDMGTLAALVAEATEATVDLTPPGYVPGRPVTPGVPDGVPPEWPGMYL